MNIFIYLYDLCFLRYRECPYSGTVRIRLLSLTYRTVKVVGYFTLKEANIQSTRKRNSAHTYRKS